jgi:hypothetical protein
VGFFDEKNWRSKISWHCPFKAALCAKEKSYNNNVWNFSLLKVNKNVTFVFSWSKAKNELLSFKKRNDDISSHDWVNLFVIISPRNQNEIKKYFRGLSQRYYSKDVATYLNDDIFLVFVCWKHLCFIVFGVKQGPRGSWLMKKTRGKKSQYCKVPGTLWEKNW